MRLKRIFCLILAAFVIYTQPGYAFVKFSDTEGESIEEIIAFFNDLGYIPGFIDGSFKPEVNISRADFSIMTAKLNGCRTDEYQGENVFADVTGEDNLDKYVSFLCGRGIINGVSDTEFAPNDGISPTQAAVIVLRNLGYTDIAESRGGYPNGYLKLAAETGILKGVDMGTEFLSRGGACRLLFNMINTETIDLSEVSDENHGFSKNGTFMSRVMKMSKKSGIVTATGYGSLYGAIDIGNEKIAIDYKIYDCKIPNSDELLGYNVIYYTNKDDTVVAAYPRNNVTLELTQDEISERSDTKTVIYYDSAERERTARLSDNVYMVYNGRGTASLKTVRPGYGKLRLIDHNNDGIYDAAISEDYKNYRVIGVSKSEGVISAKSGEHIKTDDGGVCIIKDGEKISAEKIEPDSIVSVASSENGDKVNIYVSTDRIAGKIMKKNSSESSVVIDETEYKTFEPRLFEELDAGKGGTFYLDFMGNIADAEYSDDNSYAYLKNVLYTEDDEVSLKLKLTDAKGTERVIGCRDKINILCGDAAAAGVKPSDAAVRLYEYERCIIKYTVNSNDEIIKLELPAIGSLSAWGENALTCNFDSESFALDTGNAGTCRYSNGYMILYPNAELRNRYGALTDSGTVFFMIDENNDSCRTVTRDKVSTTVTFDGMKLYDVSEYGVAGCVLIYCDSKNTQFNANTDYFMTVSDIGEMIVDDDTVNYVDGFSLKSSEKVRMYIKDDNRKSYSINSYDGFMYKKGLYDSYVCDISDVGKGDVIQFRIGDSENEIGAFRRMNKCGNKTEYMYGYDNSDETVQQRDLSLNFLYSPLTAYCRIEKVGSSNIVVNNSVFSFPYSIPLTNYTIKVVKVGENGKSVQQGDLSDVLEGAWVNICLQSGMRWLQITIYEG